MPDDAQMLRPRDGWYVVWIINRIGVPMVRWLAHTPTHPNHLTISALVIRSSAVYALWIDSPWIALLLWQLGFLLDCMDGQLARLTDQTSKFGQILDQWGDALLILLMISAMANKLFWPAQPALLSMAALWFLFWLINWILTEFGRAAAEQATLVSNPNGLWPRYRQWTAQRGLQIFPITGIEEYTLIIPISYALGVFDRMLPLLLLLRVAALGLKVAPAAARRLRS